MFVWYLSTLNKFSFLHEVKVLSTLFKKENLLCAKWYTCAATCFDACTTTPWMIFYDFITAPWLSSFDTPKVLHMCCNLHCNSVAWHVSTTFMPALLYLEGFSCLHYRSFNFLWCAQSATHALQLAVQKGCVTCCHNDDAPITTPWRTYTFLCLNYRTFTNNLLNLNFFDCRSLIMRTADLQGGFDAEKGRRASIRTACESRCRSSRKSQDSWSMNCALSTANRHGCCTATWRINR